MGKWGVVCCGAVVLLVGCTSSGNSGLAHPEDGGSLEGGGGRGGGAFAPGGSSAVGGNTATNSTGGARSSGGASSDMDSGSGSLADAGHRVPVCGDGVVDATEACDDGNRTDTDACKNDCTENGCTHGLMNLGCFQAGQSPLLGGLAVAAGDIDGDGDLDLASVRQLLQNDDGVVAYAFNDGHGVFTPEPPDTIAVGPDPEAIAMGDFNRDGKADFVTNQHYGGASVVLSRGTGFNAYVPESHGDLTWSVVTADVNHDGYSDIVEGNDYDTDVGVFLNDGHGGFTYTENPAAGDVHGVAVCDTNGDGKLDIVATVPIDGQIVIFQGDGQGGFSRLPKYSTGALEPQDVVCVDLNGDGKADIVFTGDSAFGVVLSTPSGAYQPPLSVPYGSAELAAGDLDGDGDLDIATSNGDVFQNDGTGHLKRLFWNSKMVGAGITLGDFNGDHRLDLATAGGVFLTH